ncbi:hypothetical protein MUA23_05450 [Mammaliicoccus sciuri]|uniref:hypothetical protein n=1 Tax=Mammaliicoccus sciuri TaxID=1296 RepID=UPI0021D2F06E|nr:hypothetical protein [Mammaliicoccus sciuri]UXU72922.1 hypothetical protein MUA23_05450 [Mammaliicoccus sciuri]
MGRKKKTVYIYEPLYNKLTPTTYKEIAGWLGISHRSVKDYGVKKLYHHKIRAYILNEKPNVTAKREMNFKLKVKDEIWKKTNIHGLKVSNFGRFKAINIYGNEYFILPNMVKGSVYIIYKGETMSARNIVYKAFVGPIKEGNQVFVKNEPKHNIGADNLMQMTFDEYVARMNRKKRCKPVVFLDENGQLIDEYKSTVQAAEETLYDRKMISKVCKGELKVPYTVGYANAFMWADEYYEKEGIC